MPASVLQVIALVNLLERFSASISEWSGCPAIRVYVAFAAIAARAATCAACCLPPWRGWCANHTAMEGTAPSALLLCFTGIFSGHGTLACLLPCCCMCLIRARACTAAYYHELSQEALRDSAVQSAVQQQDALS